MEPTLHTKLLNFIIGLCKHNVQWVHPLADLGYKVQLIEQMISTESGEKVKPDVVAASNKLLNSLVFECKGGITLDEDQLERYKELKENDLLRWVDLHTTDNVTHDICLVGFESNYKQLSEKNKPNFPILSFSEIRIWKSGSKFVKNEVQQKFESDIDISALVPPLSYYPFSELDDKRVIIPYVLRTIVSLLINKQTKRKMEPLNENTFSDKLVLSKVHPLWDVLSLEHRSALESKVKKIITELKGSYPKLKESIDVIERTRSTVSISNFIETCQDIISKEESKQRIDDFT